MPGSNYTTVTNDVWAGSGSYLTAVPSRDKQVETAWQVNLLILTISSTTSIVIAFSVSRRIVIHYAPFIYIKNKFEPGFFSLMLPCILLSVEIEWIRENGKIYDLSEKKVDY